MAIGYSNYPYFKGALKTVPVMLASRPTDRKTAPVRKASYTNTLVKRRRTRPSMGLKALIKRTEAAKHFSFDNNAALLHNTMYTCIPTQGITQGTGNINRIGDEIYLCALKVLGQYLTSTTAGAYSLRILVGWTGEEYNTAGISSSLVSGLGTTEVFLPGTVSAWTPNGLINPKAFTVLYDQTVDINSQITATSDLSSFEFTVPINQTFCYQSSGSVQGKTRNLAVVVCAGVAYGVTGTTSAGNCIWSCDLIYKD